MILSDHDIRKALAGKRITISPMPDLSVQLGSNSIDLRLGNTFRTFNQSKTTFLDPSDPKTFVSATDEVHIADTEVFTLHPGEFALGMTKEFLEMPDDLVGTLEGRSSIGRLGIVIHSTAASIDAGFRGIITLELANMGKIPVLLRPGIRICAVSFEELTSPVDVPYHKKKSAKYSGQTAPLPSKIGDER